MAADGSHPVNVTDHAADDGAPAWSPSGTRIAFMSNRTGNSETYVMGADGSDPVNVTKHAAEDGFPSWSPDGRRIAFTSSRDGSGWESSDQSDQSSGTGRLCRLVA